VTRGKLDLICNNKVQSVLGRDPECKKRVRGCDVHDYHFAVHTILEVRKRTDQCLPLRNVPSADACRMHVASNVVGGQCMPITRADQNLVLFSRNKGGATRTASATTSEGQCNVRCDDLC
jgi:murein endopeptidase